MKYNNRMQPVWDQLKKGLTQEERIFNRKLLLNSRSGEFLIKSTDKYTCQDGYGYINYTFRNDGWISPNVRRQAQWFSKEEAVEIIKNWKGYKIVKR